MILARDLGTPEGPTLLADGSWLVTEMAPARGCVTWVAADGSERRVIARTGRPNGLAVDADGVVWVAESLEPAVLRLTPDGDVETAFTEADGRALVWPNDLAFGPDGALYLTDSGILVGEFLDENGIVPGWAELPYDGRVCRLDVGSGRATTLDEGIRFTNGIAFGPDGALYVNETMSGNVYRYRLPDGGRELFGNVLDPEFDGAGLRGPDGMKFDAEGRLWVTVFGQGDVTVLARDGSVARRLRTEGSSPTNVAFGPRGSGRIVVTETELDQLEAFDVGVDGLPLHDGRAA